MYVAGLLTCDDATRCPEDCPICNTCLSIIGCNVTDIPDPGLNGKGILGNLSKEELLYIVGAAIAVVLLFLIVLCRSRKSSEKMEDLKKDLMAGESADDGTDCETHASQSYNPAWQPPKEIYSEFKPEGNEGPFDENTKLQDVDLESPQVSNDAPLVSLEDPVEPSESKPAVTDEEDVNAILPAHSTNSAEEVGELDSAENGQNEVNVDELNESESIEEGKSVSEEESYPPVESSADLPTVPSSSSLEKASIDEAEKSEISNDDEAEKVSEEATAEPEDLVKQEVVEEVEDVEEKSDAVPESHELD